MERSARNVNSIFLLIVFSSLPAISGEVSEETKEIINKWAPKLWVHHEEFFKPSNVEYFLLNTQVQDQNDAVLQESPTAGTILNGESTANYNLNTKFEISGPQDFLPFFQGQDVRVPGLVRTYAIVTEYGDASNTIDVKFYVFNPYNYGKGRYLYDFHSARGEGGTQGKKKMC